MSSKDVVVVVKLEEVDTSVASLDILLISTAGAKDVKTYTDPEDIAKDYTAESAVYKKAKVMMGQGKAKPTPASLIKKVKVVGFAEPESPEALVNAIKTFQDKDNDWYMFLTDQHEDAYIKALAAFAADSEPSEAELTAGVEDHRKFYFAETDNKELKLTDRRTVVIYTGNLDEQAEAAWIGSVGPWYPQSVTWKFKMPVGVSVPNLKESELTILEENHVNWVTNEYKKNYIKNGCCADGEWIDTILGGDWIAKPCVRSCTTSSQAMKRFRTRMPVLRSWQPAFLKRWIRQPITGSLQQIRSLVPECITYPFRRGPRPQTSRQHYARCRISRGKHSWLVPSMV